MANVDDQIQKLEAEKTRIEQALKNLNAQKKDKERKEETRRKILAGAWLFDQIEQGQYSLDRLHSGLDVYLEKKRDRALFDLPERTPPE